MAIPATSIPPGTSATSITPTCWPDSTPTSRPMATSTSLWARLWYHDHRVDFTSQNTYKGLTGFYCLFNQFDTGDSSTGFHLPDFPQFDIPLSFSDRVYDPSHWRAGV